MLKSLMCQLFCWCFGFWIQVVGHKDFAEQLLILHGFAQLSPMQIASVRPPILWMLITPAREFYQNFLQVQN